MNLREVEGLSIVGGLGKAGVDARFTHLGHEAKFLTSTGPYVGILNLNLKLLGDGFGVRRSYQFLWSLEHTYI